MSVLMIHTTIFPQGRNCSSVLKQLTTIHIKFEEMYNHFKHDMMLQNKCLMM